MICQNVFFRALKRSRFFPNFFSLAAGAQSTGLLFDPEPPADSAYVRVIHAGREGAVDVLSADGNTRVFTGVAPRASNSLAVNPITIELNAVKPGEKAAQAHASVAVAQGGTYSIPLLPGEGGKLTARAIQNKVERYTGK